MIELANSSTVVAFTVLSGEPARIAPTGTCCMASKLGADGKISVRLLGFAASRIEHNKYV